MIIHHLRRGTMAHNSYALPKLVKTFILPMEKRVIFNPKVLCNFKHQPYNSLSSRNCHVTNAVSDKEIKKPVSVVQYLVNSAPVSVQPYLRMGRIDRPIGSWLLFWPCSWSLAMATPCGSLPDLYLLTLLGTGSFLMRGAGCTINDLLDQDIDGKVERTKDRPLVSGQVTNFQALVFLAGQLSLSLLVLLQFNWYTVFLCGSSVLLVVTYPLMKRITNWPQLFLGCVFNWGALAGWSSVQGSCLWSVCLPLYLGGICWTVVYDTIYAHQDKKDDLIIGIKSTALYFGSNTKPWLSVFAAVMTGNLALAGFNCDLAYPYYVALAVASTHVANQIISLDINNSTLCAETFFSNKYVGLIIFIGAVLGKYLSDDSENQIQSCQNNL